MTAISRFPEDSTDISLRTGREKNEIQIIGFILVYTCEHIACMRGLIVQHQLLTMRFQAHGRELNFTNRRRSQHARSRRRERGHSARNKLIALHILTPPYVYLEFSKQSINGSKIWVVVYDKWFSSHRAEPGDIPRYQLFTLFTMLTQLYWPNAKG